jgi:hypothetical protein
LKQDFKKYLWLAGEQKELIWTINFELSYEFLKKNNASIVIVKKKIYTPKFATFSLSLQGMLLVFIFTIYLIFVFVVVQLLF